MPPMRYAPHMSIIATVENGVIQLPGDVQLPNGTTVRIETVEPPIQKPNLSQYDRYKRFIGVVNDMPKDSAANHDHYLYGTKKRQIQ
jgi:hypothetical protein